MMRTTMLLMKAVAVMLALCCVCSGAAAFDGPWLDGKWHNSLTTGLWLAGASGDTVVKGNAAPVDISVGDAWDALGDLEIGFNVHYEGGKGPLNYLADLIYYKFEFNGMTPLGQTQVEPSQLLGELGVIYTLSAKELEPDVYQDVAALLGVRYNRLKTSVYAPSSAVDVEGTRDWADAYIGARYRRDLSRVWRFTLRGDIGAGGSDFAWNAIAGFEYQLSKKRTLNVGWRILHLDYNTGSGADEFSWDVDQSGPFITTTMTW